MDQRVEFCTTPDGVRLAYATVGNGPVIVKAANWLHHLEHDWESPVWRHLFRALARTHTLVRYDERGNGLSDWAIPEFSFDLFLSDLETVVDAAGLERFGLLGISQGCALSVAYAVKHPERVSHLILHGGYARGRNLRSSKQELETYDALLTLTKAGWGGGNAAFRQTWTSLFMPGASPEEAEFWNELQRVCTSPENAIAIMRANGDIDVRHLLSRVECPTLVTHSSGDAVSPVTQAEEMARGIKGARLHVLDSRNHLILQHEPAWPIFLREIESFLGVATGDLRRRAEAALASASEPLFEPGDTLARFRIVGHIASGGMGEVYEARDSRLERRVAIKVLPSDDPDLLLRFEREAKAVAALSHPNILGIYELGDDAGLHFAVTELLEGRTLRDGLRSGALDVGTAIDVAAQVALGLEAAHERGIVHRDLKPENLWLMADGRVKILDFGLAKLDAAAFGRPGAAVTMTLPGTILGTIGYMAPEQVRGEPADARADLFSLGVVLYEMLSGRLPFRGGTPPEVLAAILRETPAPLAEPVPPWLAVVVARCLEKSPEDRFQTARDIGLALSPGGADRARGSVEGRRRTS